MESGSFITESFFAGAKSTEIFSRFGNDIRSQLKKWKEIVAKGLSMTTKKNTKIHKENACYFKKKARIFRSKIPNFSWFEKLEARAGFDLAPLGTSTNHELGICWGVWMPFYLWTGKHGVHLFYRSRGNAQVWHGFLRWSQTLTSMIIRPTGLPPAAISKKTRGQAMIIKDACDIRRFRKKIRLFTASGSTCEWVWNQRLAHQQTPLMH